MVASAAVSNNQKNTDLVTAIQNNGKILGLIQAALQTLSVNSTANIAALTAIQTDLVSLVTAVTTLANLFPTPKNSSAAWTPGAITTGTQVTTTVTVAGAVLGNYVLASLNIDLQGCVMTAYVSSANTVTVNILNETGGTITLAAALLSVRVTPQ